MSGYIKIHRSIINHWLWMNPKQLRAWLYMIAQAEWQPKVIPWSKGEVITIQRGQFVTSIRKLMGEFGYFADTTIKFLNILEEQGMIKKINNSKMTIITIVNYEKYQCAEDDINLDEEADDFSNPELDSEISEEENLTSEERKVEQKAKRNPEQKSKHIYKNKELINNTLSNAHTRTREESLFDEFLNQDDFFSKLKDHFKTDKLKILELASQFKNEMLLIEKSHSSISDLKKHFINWSKYELKAQASNSKKINQYANSNKNSSTKSQDKYQARRGADAVDHAPDDYNGSF